jgi:hypothetical protein
MVPNITTNFYATDTEQLFERNKKNRTNWIYLDKEITYTFNSDGLRMSKNLNQVDDNYIFFSGTSYSMGIGLHEDDRFSNTVAKELNLDFINCAGATYSCKAQVINFFNLINSGYKLPKILVMEYAPCTGYTFYVKDKFVLCYGKHLPDSMYNPQIELYNKMRDADFYYQEANIYQHMVRATCKRLGIKLIEISFEKHDSFAKQNVPNIVDVDTNSSDINFCYARDVRLLGDSYTGHPGIGIHSIAHNMIIKSL